jgi:hypothetical protein
VQSVTVDGIPVNLKVIELQDDGTRHDVVVTMG